MWVTIFYVFTTFITCSERKKREQEGSFVLYCSFTHFPFSNCYKTSANERSTECPVCSKHLNQLARNLPFAHCSNSRLICRMSGEKMDENNPPMMLPNGHVYGFNVSVLVIKRFTEWCALYIGLVQISQPSLYSIYFSQQQGASVVVPAA